MNILCQKASTAHLCSSSCTPQTFSVGPGNLHWLDPLEDFNTATAFANLCCCLLVLIALPAWSSVSQSLLVRRSLSLVGLSSTPRDHCCAHQLRRDSDACIDRSHASSFITVKKHIFPIHTIRRSYVTSPNMCRVEESVDVSLTGDDLTRFAISIPCSKVQRGLYCSKERRRVTKYYHDGTSDRGDFILQDKIKPLKAPEVPQSPTHSMSSRDSGYSSFSTGTAISASSIPHSLTAAMQVPKAPDVLSKCANPFQTCTNPN